MAKVFTGKVAIPSEKMEEFLQALADAETARTPFRKQLEGLNEAFAKHLATKYAKKTINKHTSIVSLFIDFLCWHTDVATIEDITKGMVNSYFRRWYKSKVCDSATDSDLRVALKKFFQFLADEKGIVNQKALDALK